MTLAFKALSVVAAIDMNKRVVDRPGILDGKTAVVLDLVLGQRKGPLFRLEGIAPWALMATNQKELLELVSREDEALLEDVDAVLAYFSGRTRYDALVISFEFEIDKAPLADGMQWFKDRPFELWYAIRDGLREEDITGELLRMLPKPAVAELMRKHKSVRERFFTEEYGDLLVPCEFSLVDRALVVNRFSDEWLEQHLVGWDLRWAMICKDLLVAENAGRYSPDWLKAKFGDDADHLVLALVELKNASAQWLADNVPAALLLEALLPMDVWNEVTADWLAKYLPTRDLMAALQASGLLGTVGADWLYKHLDDDAHLFDALRAIGDDEFTATTSPWKLKRAFPNAMLHVLRRKDLLDNLTLDDLASLLTASDLAECITSDRCKQVSVAYAARHLEGEDFAKALPHTSDFGDVSFDYLISKLSGDALLSALQSTEHIEYMGANQLGELFSGETLASALDDADAWYGVDLNYVKKRCMDGGYCLYRGLDETGSLATSAVGLEWLLQNFDDSEWLAIAVREHVDFCYLDPDEFANYGLSDDGRFL